MSNVFHLRIPRSHEPEQIIAMINTVTTPLHLKYRLLSHTGGESHYEIIIGHQPVDSADATLTNIDRHHEIVYDLMSGKPVEARKLDKYSKGTIKALEAGDIHISNDGTEYHKINSLKPKKVFSKKKDQKDHENVEAKLQGFDVKLRSIRARILGKEFIGKLSVILAAIVSEAANEFGFMLETKGEQKELTRKSELQLLYALRSIINKAIAMYEDYYN